ncbi:uncharacterized protein LOC109595121 [Aethina tumida]|uniref:uncharacterized protein LOC109595121 n=1 Tax=Aethina tumida TaxID=116153 RepID=UPI00096AF1C1|nr:uncharacterized protein LOC109595121 [Aethina tumida]
MESLSKLCEFLYTRKVVEIYSNPPLIFVIIWSIVICCAYCFLLLYIDACFDEEDQLQVIQAPPAQRNVLPGFDDMPNMNTPDYATSIDTQSIPTSDYEEGLDQLLNQSPSEYIRDHYY